jgi:hypothetical protein
MSFSQTRCKPHTLAFVASYGLGDSSPTSTGGGYKHGITPLTAAALPSFTMDAEYISDADDTLEKKFSGGLVNSFSLSVDRGSNRFANLTAELLFSGTIAAGSTSAATEPSEAGINLGATTGVWYGTAYDGAKPGELGSTAHQTTDLSSSTDLADSLRSFTWNFSNNIDPQELYRIGGGLSITDSERTARTQTIEFTLDVDNWDYVTDLVDQEDQAFQILNVGAEIGSGDYYGFNLIFPLIHISSIDFAEQNGKVVQNITATVLQHATHGSVLLDVFNNKSAYAA